MESCLKGKNSIVPIDICIAMWRHVVTLWPLVWRTWHESEIVMAIFKLFCDITLWPLCDVIVWLICKKCDMCDDSASSRETRFYPNRTDRLVSDLFSVGRIGCPDITRSRPDLIVSAGFLFFRFGCWTIWISILHQVGYPDFTWTSGFDKIWLLDSMQDSNPNLTYRKLK